MERAASRIALDYLDQGFRCRESARGGLGAKCDRGFILAQGPTRRRLTGSPQSGLVAKERGIWSRGGVTSMAPYSYSRHRRRLMMLMLTHSANRGATVADRIWPESMGTPNTHEVAMTADTRKRLPDGYADEMARLADDLDEVPVEPNARTTLYRISYRLRQLAGAFEGRFDEPA